MKIRETIQATLILFVRNDGDPCAEVLLGEKNNGSVAGWVMPPGGHVEETDRNIFAGAVREGYEEVGMTANTYKKVVEIRVHFKNGREVVVHVIKCISWAGKLTHKDTGFNWLNFFHLKEIPYHRLPTGEADWLIAVLYHQKFCIVEIKCGTTRKEVRSFRTKILDRSPFSE